jgi:hypothetical protein
MKLQRAFFFSYPASSFENQRKAQSHRNHYCNEGKVVEGRETLTVGDVRGLVSSLC